MIFTRFSHLFEGFLLVCIVFCSLLLKMDTQTTPAIVGKNTMTWKIDDFVNVFNKKKLTLGKKNLKVSTMFNTKFDPKKMNLAGLSGTHDENISFGVPADYTLDQLLESKRDLLSNAKDAKEIFSVLESTKNIIEEKIVASENSQKSASDCAIDLQELVEIFDDYTIDGRKKRLKSGNRRSTENIILTNIQPWP